MSGAGTGTPATGATAYATVTELRQYLTQVPSGATNDALLGTILERATAIISSEAGLGFTFAGYATTATARRFNGGGTTLLHLPYYQSGSLTSIAPVSGLTTGTAYVLATDYEVDPEDHTFLYMPYGWPRGRYEATAKWGYGAPPAQIVQVCLEVAINLWGTRDTKQVSDVIGIEGGGAVGYRRALTHLQQEIVAATRLRYGQYGFA